MTDVFCTNRSIQIIITLSWICLVLKKTKSQKGKSEIYLLKDQNYFLKSELQQKQIVVEKLFVCKKISQKLIFPIKNTINTVIVDQTLLIHTSIKI